MQTVMQHENQVNVFLLTSHHQFWYHFCHIIIATTFGAILIPLFISHWKDDITEFHIRNASNNILHSVNQEKARYPPIEAFCDPKSDKMDKRGTILIGGYSDYYSVCEIPRSFERSNLSNFRTQGSFIHINSGKIFERDLVSSDSVAKSATQRSWVFWDYCRRLFYFNVSFWFHFFTLL